MHLSKLVMMAVGRMGCLAREANSAMVMAAGRFGTRHMLRGVILSTCLVIRSTAPIQYLT